MRASPERPVATMVEAAMRDDRAWIAALVRAEGRTLGPFAMRTWRVGESPPGPPHLWLVVRPRAFVHARRRRDGVTVLDELAVAAAHRRGGLARALVAALPHPILLKTDADNAAANACYAALGFRPAGEHPAAGDPARLHRHWWLPW